MKRSTRLGYTRPGSSSRSDSHQEDVNNAGDANDAEIGPDIDAMLGHRRRNNSNQAASRRSIARTRAAGAIEGLRRAVSAPFLMPNLGLFNHSVSDSSMVAQNNTQLKLDPDSLQASSSDMRYDEVAENLSDLSDDGLGAIYAERHSKVDLEHLERHIRTYRTIVQLDRMSDAAVLALPEFLAPLVLSDVLVSAKRSAISLCARNLIHISPNIGFYGGSIVELELCCNSIDLLPPEIGHLKNLTRIILSKNNLETLPTTIGACTKLKEVACAANKITHLPRTLGALKRLCTLNMSDNMTLQTLPQELGSCVALQDLDLTRTGIEWLPVELFRLKGLHRLDVAECPKLWSEEEYDEFVDSTLPEQSYSAPSLRELAARVLHRHQAPLLKCLQPHLKAYLAPDKVCACSFCGGPIFEHHIVRWRKVMKDGGVLVAKEMLCWRHWDTDEERIVAMFRKHEWTAPVVVPINVTSASLISGGSGARMRSRAASSEIVACGPSGIETGGLQRRIRSVSSSSLLLGNLRKGALGDGFDETRLRVPYNEMTEAGLPVLVNRQAQSLAPRASQSAKRAGLRPSHSLASFFA
ncbi:hypothetical protein HDU81_002196 [Chytriomyces hyalinus]|nr:hypothetical protein HDU81_002196 [Chytriomyces hyalinus]